MLDGWQHWLGQPSFPVTAERVGVRGGKRRALLERGSLNRNKRGAEALHTGKILVAAGLIDRAFTAPFGFQRLDRHAIGLDAAVAAAFTHELVDDHPLGRVGIASAFPPPALLRGAGLVIDQDGDAAKLRKLPLHLHQIVAVIDGKPARPVSHSGEFRRIIGDDDDALCSLRRRDGEAAVIGLAAGHGDSVVEQDLVGDVDAGGDRGADRHVSRVIVGAVAEILKHVRAFAERRFPDPIGALAAHLRISERRAVHPLRHVVAADAGIGPHALRHHGRRIVRAARAEIGKAHGHIGRLGEPALRFLELCHARRDRFVRPDALEDAFADADCDFIGIERALDGEQPVALLVAFADADGLVGAAIKLLADLNLDERALFLDHNYERKTIGEVCQILAADRPRAGDLEKADAEIVTFDLVDAELIERLADIEIAFADRDDADLRITAARSDVFVKLVRTHEGEHGIALVVVQPRFLAEYGVVQSDVEPARRHLEISGNGDVHALEAAVDHGG